MYSSNLIAISGLTLSAFFGSSSAAAIRSRATEEPVKTLLDVNGTEYASQTASLISGGYRPLSLSVYGSPALYSSVWAKDSITPGPIETIEGADYNTYSKWLTDLNSQGYVSTHVSATGPTTNEATFAGIVEKKDSSFWLQQCDLDSPYATQNATSGYVTTVESYAMYGTPDARKFCVNLVQNINNTQQTSFFSGNGYTIDFNASYNGELTKRFWRPTRLYQSAEHVITPIFQDTQVGKWEAFTNLTSAELQSEIVTQKAAGRVPIDINGGGYSNDDILYTAIFAESTATKTKQWTAVGESTGFEDNEGILADIDERLKNWMGRNNVRQAQVAVASNGTLLLERAYTYAEDDYPVVGNDDTFMLASISKMFLYAAITKIVEEGKLNYSSKPYELLGMTDFEDARQADITVQQLLDHAGGFNRDISGDPMQMFRAIALEQNLGRPATLLDVINWMRGRPLDFAPGTDESYSNYGPMLLSYLISNMTGIPYLEYLQENIFEGENVILYTTDAADHANDTVVPQTKFVGPDPRILDEYVTVSGSNGGDGIIKEEIIGTASLATTASVVARFVGKHAAWGTGGRSIGDRQGSLVGCRSHVESLPNGLDYSIIINSREYADEGEWATLSLGQVYSALQQWPVKQQ